MANRRTTRTILYRSRIQRLEKMKRLLFENWRAKLMALIVATAVWYLIKKNVDEAPERWKFEHRPTNLGPEHS
jgi:hypothetical protein